jgi:2-(1,2-epoxy-1,2-dihydrophenyl)acetyl-CoA isomerase
LRNPDTGVATLTINRPEVLNALDVATARAMAAAAASLDGDASVRCIVLRGAGRAFVAGGDLGGFAQDFDAAASVTDELLDALHRVIETLRRHDAPVLASVHGAVAGAGLSLMAGCDLVIAAEGTRFLVAYDRIGAAPDCGGTYFLPRVLGTRRAAEFMFLGESWDAATALAAGLVNRIVPAAELLPETEKLAARLAGGPTRAFGMYKALVAQSQGNTLSAQLELERAAFKAATRTGDFREGVGAFLAKKSPRFQGY